MRVPEATGASPVLSIDSITLTDTDPRDLIRSAHSAGFDLVSLWLAPPSLFPSAIVTAQIADECGDLLAETGVRVHSLELIDLTTPEDMLAALPALRLGARLGGKSVVAMNLANPDRPQVIAALCSLVEIAADNGLAVNIEPMPVAQTRTLADASDLIADAGVDAGIVFDTYHFARNGEHLEAIKAIDRSLLRYVQVSDAPASVPAEKWGMEAAMERLHPGEGDFAILEMLRLLPRDVPWAAEIPRLSWTKAGVPPRVQAAVAMESLRGLLSLLEPSREFALS
jgi:sugar phosphate isomerase/epimerase